MKVLAILLVCVAASVRGQVMGGGRPGGASAMDKNSNDAREVAWKGAGKITESYGAQQGNRHFIPVGIASVTTKVVSGLQRNMDLIVASSNCGLDQNIAGNYRRIYDCGIDNNGSFLRCDVSIWTQSWLNKEEITIDNCKPSSAQEATSV